MTTVRTPKFIRDEKKLAKLEQAYGVIGDKLRRDHIGQLVFDLGQLIALAPKVTAGHQPDHTEGLPAELLPVLTSIRDTLSEASTKFERELFMPALERATQLAREGIIKQDAAKAQGYYKTETLAEFLGRGGQVTTVPCETNKRKKPKVTLTLDDLGL